MKVPTQSFWWKWRTIFFVTDLGTTIAVGISFVLIALWINPESRWLPTICFNVFLLLVVFSKRTPSSWIFRRKFRVSESARKRARLKDWRYWNKSTISPTLQNEVWFRKPD